MGDIDQLRQLGVKPEAAAKDEDILDALAVALLLLDRTPVTASAQTVMRIRPRQVQATLDSIEPDFVPQMIAEARRRAKLSPAFARRLEEARAQVYAALSEAVPSVRKRAVGDIPDDLADDPKAPIIIARDDSPVPILIGVVVGLLYTWWLSDNMPKADDDGDGNGDGDE